MIFEKSTSGFYWKSYSKFPNFSSQNIFDIKIKIKNRNYFCFFSEFYFVNADGIPEKHFAAHVFPNTASALWLPKNWFFANCSIYCMTFSLVTDYYLYFYSIPVYNNPVLSETALRTMINNKIHLPGFPREMRSRACDSRKTL